MLASKTKSGSDTRLLERPESVAIRDATRSTASESCFCKGNMSRTNSSIKDNELNLSHLSRSGVVVDGASKNNEFNPDLVMRRGQREHSASMVIPRYQENFHALTLLEPVCVEYAYVFNIVMVLFQKIGILSAMSIFYLISDTFFGSQE